MVDPRVSEIKQLRKDIDDVLQRLKAIPSEAFSYEKRLPFIGCGASISQQKLMEANMWLWQCLKMISDETPYPHSRDASSPIIKPTADGLKY